LIETEQRPREAISCIDYCLDKQVGNTFVTKECKFRCIAQTVEVTMKRIRPL